MKNNYTTLMQGITLDNRYKIEEHIGKGGMADVYKGKDLLLERTVAIKILHQNFSGDNDFVERFKREAQAAGKLGHPNIVNMYDVGFDQGYHYIIMEYVDGETLKDYITHEGRLSISTAVRITTAIAEGLEHAHAMGIIHCDIKPHNILITANGRVKVTDFGIARAVNSSATLRYNTSVLGSVHYLSPEQAGGKAVDVKTDIYSLGVVLYEMLTGRVPYEGETAISIAIKHVKEKLTPPTRYNPNIPPLLEGVIIKALEKSPENRYESISDFISDLRLSQGFVTPTASTQMPYDFATQVIPVVPSSTMGKIGNRGLKKNRERESNSDNRGLLATLGGLPTKYMFGGVFLLFILAFLWAFLSFGNFWSNSTVVVPNVVGKEVTVAKYILDDNHLRASINEVHNPTVPAGQVISMNPEAGAEVKEQRSIHLVVSKGPGELKVPDLRGLTIEKATKKLAEQGLVLGKVTTVDKANEEDDIILNQVPAQGTAITKGSPIEITLNKKSQKEVSTPQLVGLRLGDAKKVLSDLGLTIMQIDGVNDDDALITKQSIAGGTLTPEGSALTVTTEEKDKETVHEKSGTIDITVPNGSKSQTIKIVVIDDNGRRVIYDRTHKAGDRIEHEVHGKGQVRIQVYLNGALVQDQTL